VALFLVGVSIGGDPGTKNGGRVPGDRDRHGLAFISDQRVDPGLARALNDVAQVFSYIDWFPVALLFAALALAVLRTRIIAAWLGWAAAAIAVLALIAAPPTLGLDVPASLISFLWIVVVSTMLGITSSRSVAAGA